MFNKIILVINFVILTTISAVIFAESKYYGGELCGYSEFHCIAVKRGDSWQKLWPTLRERELVQRLNRNNVTLSYRPYIVVPRNIDQIEAMDLSPFESHMNTHGGKLLLIDLNLQAFGAYNEVGDLLNWGPISGGKEYCKDLKSPCQTPVGTFYIQRIGGADCKSKKFPLATHGGAPMPYCMYFYGGFALHGSTLPGFHVSHGCVRLFTEDAKWLNLNFVKIGTKVIIRSKNHELYSAND